MSNIALQCALRRKAGVVLIGLIAAAGAGAAWAADPALRETAKPVWVQQPTFQNLARAYPRDAHNAGAGGMAVIDCRVAPNGTLEACTVEKQKPAKYAFGEAGLKLAPYFRMEARDEDGRPTAGNAVRIPILFKLTD